MPQPFTKKEYETMLAFYQTDEALTRRMLIGRTSMNPNTAALHLKELYKRGYLRVTDVTYSGTVLARAFRPTMPFLDFYIQQKGKESVTSLVRHVIGQMEDQEALAELLTQIRQAKNNLKKNNLATEKVIAKEDRLQFQSLS